MYHIFDIGSYILEAVLCPRGWGEFLWNQMTELIKQLKEFVGATPGFFWVGQFGKYFFVS